MTAEVIKFPRSMRDRPPQTLEEAKAAVEVAKLLRIEEASEEVIVSILDGLTDRWGYNFDDEAGVEDRDIAMLVEAVKGLLYKHDGLSHPFHSLSQQIFVADADGDFEMVSATPSVEQQVVTEE